MNLKYLFVGDLKMDFDKFMKDIEKKEEAVKNNMPSKEEIEYYEMLRKRNFIERELWQNRISWSQK